MKLVAMADLHLGFRQFDKLAPNGINAREIDVAMTAARVFDAVIAERPDAVVVGGDIFHVARPSNPAIVHGFSLFAKLRAALPATPIIVVAGNHDAPRTSDAGCILQLFRSLDIHVVERAVEALDFPELDLSVLAVPDVVGLVRPPLVPPNPDRRHRVLLLHGEAAGVLPVRTAHEIDVHEFHPEAWSYIALGHFHVYRRIVSALHPDAHAYYSGSIDFTSSDPWGELADAAERGIPGKGFIVHDLATGDHRFVPVPVSRRFLALPPIDCLTLTTAEIDDAIRHAIEQAPGGIDDAVVRVLLLNATPATVRALSQEAIRAYRERAFHLQLDRRKPEQTARAITAEDIAQRTTLDDLLVQHLQDRPLAAEIDRSALITLARDYMARAKDTTPMTAVRGEV